MRWLFEHPANEQEFQRDAQQVVDVARKNMNLDDYARYIQNWAKDARKNKDLKTRGAHLDEVFNAYRNDPNRKLWEVSSEQVRGRTEREQLLKQNLTDDQFWHVAYHQCYSLRHKGNDDQRRASVDLYGKLAKRFSERWDAASWWIEAAIAYGTPEQKKQATQHGLTFPAEHRDPQTWMRMMDSAAANKDQGLARQVIAWIAKYEAAHGVVQDYSHGIGNMIMDSLDMKPEAMVYFKAHLGPNLDHSDVAANLGKILTQVDDPMKMQLLAEMASKESDNHGAYAAGLAELYFKAGDLVKFEALLRKHRKLQDARGGRKWSMGEWPAQGWIDQVRANKEMPEADKLKVFKVIADMGLGRTSAVAQLNILSIEPVEKQGSIMKRLLAYQETTLVAGAGTGDWDRLKPYAQETMTRKEYPESATLLSGMLANIHAVDAARKQSARSMIGQAFSRMGSIGLEINNDSPIAPLMQISLFLRLGDRDLAFKTYEMNKKLFDEHRAKLPLEIILFAAETHIAGGGEENHNEAEDILRSWLIKNAESKDVGVKDKAQVQLLLGRNYFKSGRFEVSRSEFASVKNQFPGTEEALEAEFGIGESFMAQKVFDKAEEIFSDLANSRNSTVVIRAEFLRGVLANRKGERDEARSIFRAVLERMPDVELANETLYNLAEVYGVEQRYTDQLELLRTVGRLGRDSKRWHSPGNALSIVVQDSDLGISRGEARIPVKISTEPGGDEEIAYLTSGGAGKGLFLAEIDTGLGAAVKADNLLQLTGMDTIMVDYPEEFKGQFKFHLLANNEIKIASDAEFEAASSHIEDAEEDTITRRLEEESMSPTETMISLRSNIRPSNQIKPGNLVYFRVEDKDRDLSDAREKVPVKIVATSGDEVRVDLEETAPHSGIFEGRAQTGELPAGALASDTSIEHNPLMAIDHDRESRWLSEPDGVTPKWLSVDLKDLKEVSKVAVYTPDAEVQAPIRMQVHGSADGRYWYKLGEYPKAPDGQKLSEKVGAMTQYVYKVKSAPESWSDLVEMFAKHQPESKAEVHDLSWNLEEDEEKSKSTYVVVWMGKLVQEQDGGVRFGIDGKASAAMVNGHLVQPMVATASTVDVHLARGIHEVIFYSLVANNQQGSQVKLAREDLNSEKIVLGPFRPGDLDLNLPEAKRIAESTEIPVFELGTAEHQDAEWHFAFNPIKIRHARLTINEYAGEAVAINHLEIGKEDTLYIPTSADVLSLSTNNVLELTAGDTASAMYIDELTDGGGQRNRILTQKLQATYYNGQVHAIGYDFIRSGDGSVLSIQKDLMRIEPGDRIGIVVTDFDMDATAEIDTLEVEVVVNDVVKKLTATETFENSGSFKTEIDTSSSNVVDRLTVQAGDRIYLRYTDRQNTFPGHTVPRERVVFVNEPTKAAVRIVDTRYVAPSESRRESRAIYLPAADKESKVAGMSYNVPLTVEVYDPDRAMDNLSRIDVALSLGGTNTVNLTCVVSEAFGEATTAPVGIKDWALFEGRFVGQVVMQLGGPGSPDEIPSTPGMSKGLVGWANDKPLGGVEGLMLPVLNLTGKDTVHAVYKDERRPEEEAVDLEAKGRLITDGILAITEHDYEKPMELLHVGEKLYVMVQDPDMDTSDERDQVKVQVTSRQGEKEDVVLDETLSHSGVFTGAFELQAQAKPAAGNFQTNAPSIECFFGDEIQVVYHDLTAGTEAGSQVLTNSAPVAVGTDGLVSAFSKLFQNDELAIQTQFHIAESYFELFKSHLKLERDEEAQSGLANGRRLLKELMEDYADPEYLPRILYLLGQFAQEMKEWDDATLAYERIVRDYAEHTLAADAQYKLAQCYEEAGEFDEALEAYVTLASTYPQSPLIANVMIRINEYFYKNEDFLVAAQVGKKFVERFESHEWSARMAFRVGQCYHKSEEYQTAGEAFDEFAKRFPDNDLCAEALFWGGESYRMARNVPFAFRRYNRCRWDFPESDAAKYSRGRLALPEMLAQFEKEANLEDGN
jgi:TolA-binding protein